MSATWRNSSHGVTWQVALETDRLLPGRLTAGTITISADDPVDARGLVAALVAVEH